MRRNKAAKPFYNSKAWITCRTGYMQSQHFICERCGGIASICHHKKWITPENIGNPSITLNWDNLEALCQTCHNQEHHSNGIAAAGLIFNSNGELIEK